jgi:erythromycin esterase
MKILLSFFFILSLSSYSISQTKLSVGESIQKKINLGDTHVYNIKVKKGGFYKLMIMQKGIDLVIEVESPGSKRRTFDTPNGRDGPELVEFPAMENGNSKLKVTPYPDTTNARAGDYIISYVEKLSPSEYAKVLKKQEEEKTLLVEWIKQNSIPLKSVNAGSGHDDLDKLKPVLTNKRVIGLGEASHGTKEFFQMKHRMLEYLVQELGFTVFAIEASYGRCKYINNYILTGEGNLDTAIVIQGFTTWNTEEVKDMISWMRDYNVNNPDTPVRFVGFDLQVNDAAAFDISKYYLKVDPGRKAAVDSLLKEVLEVERKGGIISGDSTILTLIAPFEDLISDYSSKEDEYILKSSHQEYDEILWSEKILQ